MFMVCGEALMDVFAQGETAAGIHLDARIGGSPMNVAIGLARLGQRVDFLGGLSRGFLGERLRRAMAAEGVGLSRAVSLDAATTLGLVGLDASGSASYNFYGQGCADRLLRAEHLPVLGDECQALHFGSYTMVVEPVASTLRILVERERGRRLISYDPNLRLNVEPDRARWAEAVTWMAQRAHLIKVSSEDLELLRPGQPIAQVVQEWLALGVSLVVVTDGGQGAAATTPRCSVTVPATPVQLVDTVGAGDTFQAAMLCWLAERGLMAVGSLRDIEAGPLREMLGFAATAAGITCTRRGADMPRRAELS
jgi:fructokinase